jgi:hypothetical protein
METATLPQEPQVKDGNNLNGTRKTGEAPMSTKPEECKEPVSELSLEAMIERMHHCSKQAGLWQEQGRQYQTKVSETLERFQKQFSVNGNDNGKTEKKKAPRPRIDKNATVPHLIRTFLETNGAARTKDIRKFLLSHGRTTNPGVALSRMVKSGDLKHTERGVYKMA